MRRCRSPPRGWPRTTPASRSSVNRPSRRLGCDRHRRARASRTATTSCSSGARTASTRSRSRRSSRTWAPRWVSMELGTRGPLVPVQACAASNMAIGHALDEIRSAAPMPCSPAGPRRDHEGRIGGFGAMRALSRRNEEPTRRSRPFDAERDGFVMGEAGGHSRSRGARAREEAGREDLRRAGRLRHLLGCAAHHRA